MPGHDTQKAAECGAFFGFRFAPFPVY